MKKYQILVFAICLTFIFIPLSNAQYALGNEYLSFQDPERNNRTVSGQLFYPANTAGVNTAIVDGSFPLIVFGHGFGMSWMEYEIWWQTLVPQGYFLFLPDTEQTIFPFPVHADFGADLSFLVNQFMDLNEDANSPFYQKLNERNAIMGHSMGGGCSYLAADSNENITTIVTLAAAETTPSAINAANNIAVPVLTIAGAADCVVMEGGGPIDIYNALQGDAYRAFVNITDASHCQFGTAIPNSICLFGEFCSDFLSIETQHDYMLNTANPWLNYYLKGDCSAWNSFEDYLQNSDNHTYMEAGIGPSLPDTFPTLLLENASITLSFDDDFEVQWLLNDVLIEGANSSVVSVMGPGIYSAQLSYESGCNVVLDPIEIDLVSNQEINTSFSFDCYPSFATDCLYLTLKTEVPNDFILQVVHISGTVLKREKIKVPTSYQSKLNIADLPRGIYFLHLYELATSNSMIHQFIKQD